MDDKIKLDRMVVSGISWKLAERIFNQGISFLVTIILARLLTPNDYGVVAMVNVFVVIADIILSSGFTSALIQKKNVTNKDYSTIFYLNLMISVGLYALLFFSAPLIANLYNMDSLVWVLRIIALKLPLSAFYTVQSAHISRNMNFKIFFFSTIVGSIVSAIVGIVMAKKGFGVWSLVAQQLVSVFVGSVIMFFTIKWKPGLEFSRQSIKETRGFATRIMAADVIGTLFNQLNSFLIGIKYTSEDLAYYSKGQNLPNIATNIASTSFVSVLYPAMSKISDEKLKIKKLLQSATKMFTFIVFPLLFGMFIVATDLIEVLYTSKWLNVSIYLQIMCISSMISMLGEFDILTLKSIGKTKIILIMELIKKPIFLIVTFISIQFGVVWIATGMILINLIALVINSYALKKEINYGVKDKFKDCLNSVVLSLFMILAVYLIGLVPINYLLIRLIVKILVGMIVYLGLAYILNNNEFKAIIKFIKSKLKKSNNYSQVNNPQLKNLIVCNTVYQIIVASAIASSQKGQFDIIITDHSKSAEDIVVNIKNQENYFTNCNFIKSKQFCFDNGNLNEVLSQLQDKHILEYYDKFYCANWEKFTQLMYKKLKAINKDIELSWMEDGFGTYSFDGKMFDKPSLKRIIKSKIKNEIVLYNEIKSLNLFKPELLEWEVSDNVSINKICDINEECKNYINKIFNYESLTDNYNKKLIFFQDGYKEFDDMTDVEVLEQIADVIGKENILVKRHPRDCSNKFENRGFVTNSNTTMPSELIILNNDFNNTIFATFYSQSIITSGILFNKKIKSIILSKINNKDNNNDSYFNYLFNKIYSKDKETYIIPNSIEELKITLKEEKNKGT